MSEHTPGPWITGYSQVVTEYNPTEKRTYGYGCGNDFICDLNDGEYHEYVNMEEQAANARLIAAAPQLLEACEAALNNIDLNVYDCDKIERELSEAIAAAKGES